MKRHTYIWAGFLWLNAIMILSFWIHTSGPLILAGGSGTALALGRVSGLIAAFTVLLQFVFMGRMVWLERAFGLDRLSRIHSLNGKLTLVFLIAHPLLIIGSYASASGVNWAEQIKNFLIDYDGLVKSLTAALIFIGVVVSSIYIVRKKFRYESWYFVHLAVYLAVYLSFEHQIELGGDLIANKFFYGYWVALYTVVFVSHIVFRFGRPVYLYHKHKFKVSRVVRENHNTVSVYITGEHIDQFRINAGQFMILRFFTKGLWWQAHPFSLSMIPTSDELRVTIKELGDFTRSVQKIPAGTKLMIDGPYGTFTNFFGVSQKTLLIAGGIGITPIRSLMEEMLANGKQVTVLYAARSEQDLVFKNELEALVARHAGQRRQGQGRGESVREHETPMAQIQYVLSDSPVMASAAPVATSPVVTGYLPGHIDESKLKSLIPDLAEHDVYICGPVPMMTALVQLMQNLGVARSKIHYEKFSLA